MAVAQLLDDLLANPIVPRLFTSMHSLKLNSSPAGQAILALSPKDRAIAVIDAMERHKAIQKRCVALNAAPLSPERVVEQQQLYLQWGSADLVLKTLLRGKLPLGVDCVAALVEWGAERAEERDWLPPLAGIVTAAEHGVAEHGCTPRLRAALQRLVEPLRRCDHEAEYRKLAARINALLTDGPQISLTAGEAWSDAALADLAACEPGVRRAWEELLSHCQAIGSGKPTQKWRKAAQARVDALGFERFKTAVERWFPKVDEPKTAQPPHPNYGDMWYYGLEPAHVDMLRGLAAACGLRADTELAKELTALARSAYRKLPSIGPRLMGLGNACVAALGAMPGLESVGQLAILKAKVKVPSAQKQIDNALAAAAEREDLPPSEIEELAVPACGLDAVGQRRETIGDYAAEIAVDGSDAELNWSSNGKALKSVPAAVKSEHAGELKELQAALKDVQQMLPAQRDRLDRLFLERKSWSMSEWRERYLDHPLVGTLARRLIWTFDGVAAAWLDGRLVDAVDRPLNPKADATVELWHPLGAPVATVLAWREWLERHKMRQPFKQAHREIYVLTDAERVTGTYSNRFAGHVVRQHQFNALAAARGWNHRVRVLFSQEPDRPAERRISAWNLRVEYWVHAAGDRYGVDTNEGGSFLHLTTDQVRFYPLDGEEPLALADVPPLVFSEEMRDCDLFVGVASVAGDPTWSDGGPDGRYREYWQSVSFGDLSATAQTRKALLERLVPRLAIAERCSFLDRFLVVRGDLRSYKIHLGSGNILMSPTDQYLCIVPEARAAAGTPVFLPFEGDRTLSIILSKAFLLAADTKISDRSIRTQLGLSPV